MKHPNHITKSHIRVTYEEVKPMIEALALRLSEMGISATVDGTGDCYGDGYSFQFRFAKPIEGRDWKRSRVHCTGFGVFVLNCVGADEAKDANGHFIWDSIERGPKTVGEEYSQYTAYFSFKGEEYRFRCRRRESIQDHTMTVFDYSDNLSEIDFRDNLKYLLPIMG